MIEKSWNKGLIPLFLLLVVLGKTGVAQEDYKSYGLRPPLNIPLILAGNFAELRKNHFHTGLDIKTKGAEGYRIYAVDSGYVSRINISHWGYGKCIYVDHPNGLTSVYAHLSRFPEKIERYLRSEQFKLQKEVVEIYPDPSHLEVEKGEIIAYSGNTGSSGGPHLHFELRDTKTEHPLNPLMFGFDIKDDIKPTLGYVKAYPLKNGKVRGKSAPYLVSTTGGSGNYTVANPIKVSGEVGFGVHAIDKLNGANNVCGIYTIALYKNDTIVFMQTMKELDFSTSRYINTHKDYDEYHKHRRSIHKSFIDGNNQLDIYDSLVNNGKILFSGGAHNMKYVVKDTYGNQSIVKFKVIAEKPVVSSAAENFEITYQDTVKIQEDDFAVVMPDHAVYNELKLDYSSKYGKDSLAKIHHFQNSKVPVQAYFVMKIKMAQVAKNHENKAVVVELQNNGKTVARGGEFKDGWVETEVRAFGDYTVKLDTVQPTLVPINIVDNKTFPASTKNIKFKIGDNLSGVQKYDVFIDGEWKLANYVPKRALLSLPLDKYNNIAKGEHELKVRVEDERGNVSEKNYKFKLL